MANVNVTKIQNRRSKTAAYRPPTTGGTALADGEQFYNLLDGQWRVGGIATDIPLLIASTAEANAGTVTKLITPVNLQAALTTFATALTVTVDGGQEG